MRHTRLGLLTVFFVLATAQGAWATWAPRSPVYDLADPGAPHVLLSQAGPTAEQERARQERLRKLKAISDMLAALESGNYGSFLKALKNADNFTNIEGLRDYFKKFKTLPSWAHALFITGAAAEMIDLLGKAGKAGQSYAGSQGDYGKTAQTVLKEIGKWALGNFVGGHVCVVFLAGVTSPGWGLSIVTGLTAWGAIMVTEYVIDYESPHDKSQREYGSNFIGALHPDLVRWLGTRIRGSLVIDLGQEPPLKIPDGLTAEELIRILRTAQANSMNRAREVLEGLNLPGQAPTPPDRPIPTYEELADMIPPGIVSEAELKALVVRLARDAVRRRGLGGRTGELSEEDQVRAFVNRAWPYVRRAFWMQRRQWEREFATIAESLDDQDMMYVTSESDPELLGPPDGKVTVTVTAHSPKLSTTLTKLRWILRRLTGKTPSVRMIHYWTGGNIKQEPVEGPEGNVRKFEYKAPGKYEVFVRRMLLTNIDASGSETLPNRSVLKKKIVSTGSASFEVKGAEFPTELAGTWRGQLLIKEFPGLGEVNPNDPPPVATDNEGLSNLLETGMRELFQVLKALEGKPLTLVSEIQPLGPGAGMITFEITLPEKLGGKPRKAPPFPYRYANGVLTVDFDKDEIATRMRGTFELTPKGWAFKGTWNATKTEKGVKQPLANGTWSGVNPKAK